MRAAGLDDTSPGFFSGPIGYPFSGTTSSGSETDLTYRHSRRLAFGLRRTSIGLGSTHGYQADWKWITVSSRVTTFAPIVYFRAGPNLRIGAGPLTASTDVAERSAPSGGPSFKSTAYGGLVTASLEGTVFRYISIGLNVSRVWIPEVAVGPFTSGSGIGGTATLPAMRVNLSHQTFGVSLGIRF
jgi:hypothetical protein